MGQSSSRDDLVARYERLRRDALGAPSSGGEGFGLALFLRRGMTAWIEAWLECTCRTEPATRSEPGVDETIPTDTRAQLTALLAGMILCVQQEATS
jgi:hypothetical protein